MDKAESELLDDAFLAGEKAIALVKKWREKYAEIEAERDKLRSEISATIDRQDKWRSQLASSQVALARQIDISRDLAAERDRLRACIERIDSINDSPATFNKEIDEAIATAVAGNMEIGFRSIISWEKKQ